MKRFRVERESSTSIDGYEVMIVTLHKPPYENENILHKTGWKEKDVIIAEIYCESSSFDEIEDSSIDKDYIGEE